MAVPVFVFIGPQGSGKGTQAQLLAAKYGWDILVTGYVIRDEVRKDTSQSIAIRGLVQRGELIPDQIVVDLIRHRIEALRERSKGVVIDGFPRTVAQAAMLEQIMPVTKAIHITVPATVILKRISGRLACAQGHSYNQHFVQPKHEGVCDVDGLPLARREDDTDAAIGKRLAVYQESTVPLLDYYRAHGVLCTVNGNASIDAVHQAIVQEITPYAH